MKWIKLFTGTADAVQADVNEFLAKHKLEADFIETRPIALHGLGDVGALCCVNYTAAKPVKEVAPEVAKETETAAE
jgi:hypothetical protein